LKSLRRQDNRTSLRYGNAVLKVGAVTAILGDCCPIIVQQTRPWQSHVYHWFNSQHHAVFQKRPLPGYTEIGDLRFLMQLPSNSVSYKLANHAEAIRLNIILHGGSDVAHRIANYGLVDATVQSGFSHVQQPFQFRRNLLSYRNRHRRVGIKTIDHDAAVDRNNIPGFQNPPL